MVWHIVRKDWKLLWRMVVVVALINAMQRALLLLGAITHAPFSPQATLSLILEPVSLLAVALLIVMVVQQDPLPGLRQDWLVRPIRRRDLLLSKLLFVLLFVQGPIFLAEVCQCLAAGFPLRQSLTAPLSRSLWMLLAFDLPVLAFATLTRNLAQAAGAAIAMAVGYVLSLTVIYQPNPELVFGDWSWVNEATRVLWGMLAVVGVLALQYSRGKILRARWLYGAATMVWIFLQFLPWKIAFAVETQLSPEPASANPIQIAFLSGVGRYHSLPDEPSRRTIGRSRNVLVSIRVPVRINGLGQNQHVMGDRVSARLIEPDGTAVDLYSLAHEAQAIWIDRDEGYQRLWVPQDLYKRLHDQPVGLEIDYSFTLLESNPEQTMPATGGDRWLPTVGRCTTQRSATAALIELDCLVPGTPPCVDWRLENKLTAQRIATGRACDENAAPYLGRISGDSISRFSDELHTRFQDMADDQVVLRAYRPVAYFTRKIVTPNIRLSDWIPE